MLKKKFLITLTLLALSVSGLHPALAEDNARICVQLDTKASGEMEKYSVYGDANGPLFFSGISCAIKHRNKELCAMEMLSFDNTAKVYDYYTGEETDIGKAYFWIDEKNNENPILAFASKESAEEYEAASKGGMVMDYTGLKEREPK